MKQKKKLSIGIENFTKLQTEDFYYVDKTMLIKTSGQLGRGEPFHTPTKIWKNIEYEYAESIF